MNVASPTAPLSTCLYWTRQQDSSERSPECPAAHSDWHDLTLTHAQIPLPCSYFSQHRCWTLRPPAYSPNNLGKWPANSPDTSVWLKKLKKWIISSHLGLGGPNYTVPAPLQAWQTHGIKRHYGWGFCGQIKTPHLLCSAFVYSTSLHVKSKSHVAYIVN